MKIIISIRPKWVAKILKGEKTLEIRKTAPKCDLPIDVYIYCTKGDYIGHLSNKYVGKIVAKFTLNKVERIEGAYDELCQEFEISDIHRLSRESCVDEGDLIDYLSKGKYNNNSNDTYGYAWHISNLEIFDKPKTLADYGLKRAPQSWCYAKEGD